MLKALSGILVFREKEEVVTLKKQSQSTLLSSGLLRPPPPPAFSSQGRRGSRPGKESASMAESLDITETAAKWIAKFGAPARAEAPPKIGDDAGTDWHKTFAAVTQYLMERRPA